MTSEVIDTREAFHNALDDFPNIILAEYDLLAFNGLEALEIVKKRCPDVPFILVAGRVGEAFAKRNVSEAIQNLFLQKITTPL